jgi:hypothetical protein
MVMSEKIELSLKRAEAREEIFAVHEETTPALILHILSRAFPKNITKENPIYWLLIILALNIVILIPSLIISILLNEFSNTENILAWPIGIQVGIVALILSYYGAKIILEEIANRLVDKVYDLENLSKLRQWIKVSWSNKHIGGYVTIMWFVWFFVFVIGTSFWQGEFIGYGPTYTVIPTGLLIAVSFYYAVWFFYLSSFLGKLRYEMNSISPIYSEAISVLHSIFNKHLYLVAMFSAIATFVISLVEIGLVGLPFVLISWAIFTIQFIANRSTINEIVDGEKWNTLNKIQTQINQIEKTEDLSEKGVNEKLFRLVDTYEKIRVTSTNKLEIKSILNFFSQMMLPLLGLLLGNLNELLDLLK